MQIEQQLQNAIKRFENISLPEKLEIPKIFKDFFLPEFIGIDITENKIENIKFYYITVENNKSELLWKNRTLKKVLVSGMGHRYELSPIMDEAIRLFDFSIPYYGQDNISERIIFKCDDLNNSTREEIILNCIRAIDYHQVTSDTKRICSIIQQNVKTKKYPLHLFGFDIDLENRVIKQFKTYFSLLHFKNDASYKGVRVDELSLTSCREIIHFLGLGFFEDNFFSIYEKLTQEGALLDFLGVNYTTELSKSFKAYFIINKAQKYRKSRGFDLKKVYENGNDQSVIEEIRIVMKNFQYTPAIVGIYINENVTFDTKVYFEKMA